MFVPTQMIENLENISIMCVYQEMSNLVSFFMIKTKIRFITRILVY